MFLKRLPSGIIRQKRKLRTVSAIETEIVWEADNSIVTWVIIVAIVKNKCLMIKGIGQIIKYEAKFVS